MPNDTDICLTEISVLSEGYNPDIISIEDYPNLGLHSINVQVTENGDLHVEGFGDIYPPRTLRAYSRGKWSIAKSRKFQTYGELHGRPVEPKARIR